MDIKKVTSVSSVQPISPKKSVDKTNAVKAEKHIDSVELTKNIEQQALYKKAMSIIAKTPDIRMDKVESAKKLLKTYENFSDEVLDVVAKKILDGFISQSDN